MTQHARSVSSASSARVRCSVGVTAHHTTAVGLRRRHSNAATQHKVRVLFYVRCCVARKRMGAANVCSICSAATSSQRASSAAVLKATSAVYWYPLTSRTIRLKVRGTPSARCAPIRSSHALCSMLAGRPSKWFRSLYAHCERASQGLWASG